MGCTGPLYRCLQVGSRQQKPAASAGAAGLCCAGAGGGSAGTGPHGGAPRPQTAPGPRSLLLARGEAAPEGFRGEPTSLGLSGPRRCPAELGARAIAWVFVPRPRSRCCVKKQNATAFSTLYPTASKFECKPGDKLFFFFSLLSFFSSPLSL